MDVVNRQFRDEVVRLDGQAYIGCTLTRCVLEYHGTGPIRLESCTLDECSITYRGAAAMTVDTLHRISRSGPMGLDHVMRLFLPAADIDWGAIAATPAPPAKVRRTR